MANFPSWIYECDSHNPTLVDLFIFSNTSVFLGNFDYGVVSISISFLSNSKWNVPFHCVAYDYSCVDWDDLCNHLRNVPLEDIFKLSASAGASEFCEWVQVGINVYVSRIVNIRSSFSHLHGFLIFIVHRNLFFVCTE